jgi:ADP-heptose:LPS heptosyltransferase
VYRAIGLGDLLTGVPALRALRRALPDHEIVLAAPRAQSPLVELIDAVDLMIPTEELEPVAWAGPPPEVAIDLHGNGPASRKLVEALRPERVVGFGLGPANPRWDPDEHERVRWCRLIVSAFGGTPQDLGVLADDLLLPAPAPAPERLAHPGAVLIHPGAASAARRWPAERFAAVAVRLTQAGREVLLTGSRGERALAESVASRAGLPDEAVLAGETDLAALASFASEAALVVCGDTGMAHLASAYATPSVLLFGPTPPSRWGPPPGPHTVLWRGRGVGDPHAEAPDPALLAIGVDEVVAECRARLDTSS